MAFLTSIFFIKNSVSVAVSQLLRSNGRLKQSRWKSKMCSVVFENYNMKPKKMLLFRKASWEEEPSGY
ncbi:hypothetical protein EG68_08080 [Paragonimus skrjabini miyazakii]|uniref:Uncharacterized protein n=1 Tax=Paragonimus skrjabini miyazakii TaxID=59628 RepID=A0A8S9YQ87_9TREM|nr:hypothetical protein EG68_08080 [Paragonimus skrjabini miyazakii]